MEIGKLLAAIDIEIERLQRAKALLSGGTTVKRGPGRPKGSFTTPEARAKIAVAQKARWAKAKTAK